MTNRKKGPSQHLRRQCFTSWPNTHLAILDIMDCMCRSYGLERYRVTLSTLSVSVNLRMACWMSSVSSATTLHPTTLAPPGRNPEPNKAHITHRGG